MPCAAATAPGQGRVIGNLMQKGGAAQGTRIRQRLGALGGVEHELDRAVLDRVDDMRPAFRDLVELLRRDALLLTRIARGAAGGDDA